MTEDDLNLEDVRRMAVDIGMTRLTDDHVQQLLRATQVARARRGVLWSADLTPADEPAHVYRLDGESSR